MFGKKRKNRLVVKKCPDGHTVEILHPDDLWPLEKESFSVSTKAGLDALTKVKAEVGVDIVRRIEGMLVLLDEASSSMVVNYRAAYSIYFVDPCEEGQLEYYKREIRSIRKQEHALRSLLVTLQRAGGILEQDDLTGEPLRRALHDVLNAVSVAGAAKDAEDAFKEARDAADAWGKGDEEASSPPPTSRS